MVGMESLEGITKENQQGLASFVGPAERGALDSSEDWCRGRWEMGREQALPSVSLTHGRRTGVDLVISI